jgi:hypothetical protein
MKIAFPVVLCLHGTEFAGVVCKASPTIEQPPIDENEVATPRQRLAELRADIAYFNPVLRSWSVVEQVPYLSQDLPLPTDLAGHHTPCYYEVGAPDPQERADAAAHEANLRAGREAYDAMSDEEKAKFRAENGFSDPSANDLGAVAAGNGGAVAHGPGAGADRVIVDELEQPQTGAELAVEEDVNEALLEARHEDNSDEDFARDRAEAAMENDGAK